MITEQEELLFKVHFVNELVNTIYKKNRFKDIPFCKNMRALMIEECEEDFKEFFKKIFKSEAEVTSVMNHFKNSKGAFILFFMMLDKELQDKLLSCDWKKVKNILVWK